MEDGREEHQGHARHETQLLLAYAKRLAKNRGFETTAKNAFSANVLGVKSPPHPTLSPSTGDRGVKIVNVPITARSSACRP